MNTATGIVATALLWTLAACVAPAAQADTDRPNDVSSALKDGISGYVWLGVGTAPNYEGSKHHDATALFAARFQSGNSYAAIDGLTFRANLGDSDWFEWGPVVSVNEARDSASESPAINALPAVKESLSSGLFVAWNVHSLFSTQDKLQLGARALGHADQGWQLRTRVAYRIWLSSQWSLDWEADVTFMDATYADTWFSITPDASQASSLDSHDADSDVKNAGMSIALSFADTEGWFVNGLLGYSRLLASAADSPIVEDAGDADQVLVGLGLGFVY